MPVKAIVKKDNLDKFYTKTNVALDCLNQLHVYTDSCDLFIEPSAGGGAFYKQLPTGSIGIDLQPECDGVVQSDWLDYKVPNNCVVVGNPPFGSRNSLTNAFIRKAQESAKIIAFVLPSVYRKESMQKVFGSSWALASDQDLPENSFTLQGEPYHVPCVFQVWIKDFKGVNLRESLKARATTKDFTFCSRKDATHFIFGASPKKVVDKGQVTEHNRGYWINTSEEVAEHLRCVDLTGRALSSVSGGVAWYGKNQIIQNYLDWRKSNDT